MRPSLLIVAALAAFFISWPAPAVPPAEKEPAGRKSPDSELAEAARWLQTVRAEDRNYVRLFTTYAVPEKDAEKPLREHCENALSFVLNNAASFKSKGNINRPKRVPGSDTLWHLDVRDYGWTEDDFTEIFGLAPYFLTPLVDGDSPGVMFRADWFVVFATDNTKLADRGEKVFPYYLLLYGKGKEPKDAREFQKLWKVDIDTIRSEQLETGTVVDAGESGVSRHTRQLRRGRTLYGYYRETRDVASHDIDPEKILSRDYVEEIFANQSDAAEYITSHKNGLQVYLLTNGTNGKFTRIEFGDPTVVVDRRDRDDVRVRTCKGCIVCHANGIIPYTNAIADLFRLGGDLRAKDRELAELIKYFYLSHDGSDVEDDNKIFERAVRKCNGLDPEENARQYLNVYEWYNRKVTLEQAALECGLGVAEYRKAIAGATTGRLVFLHKGRGMPREVWDTPNQGGYVQSMLLVKGKKGGDHGRPKPPPKEKVSPPKTSVVEVVVPRAEVLDDRGNLAVYFASGVRARVLREDENFYFVPEGRLRKSDARPVRE